MDHFSAMIKLTIALIAVVDVITVVPIFLSVTDGMTNAQRRVTALVAGGTAAVILVAFAQAGETILATFGISIDAFRVLGGIVILLMALQMLGLLAEDTSDTGSSGTANPIAVGIFPMAIPLAAGPGAISAVMIFAHQNEVHPDWNNHISLVVLVVTGLLTLVLLTATTLSNLITPLMNTIMNRLFGMIVGAMGVEFILTGLEGHAVGFIG
ncbi:MAG: MarC family protein [Pseudomonadota bacterium]